MPTLFAKVIGGGYKITLYNAMTENDFSLAAAPRPRVWYWKYAWDAGDTDLYDIEDIGSIEADCSGPPLPQTRTMLKRC